MHGERGEEVARAEDRTCLCERHLLERIREVEKVIMAKQNGKRYCQYAASMS